ncbi:MAG TPA: hypothetical protein GX516_11770 [Thermoanaerobacter sp.]|nr:hypothetical protein [Thermoanaerobacter sp.]
MKEKMKMLMSIIFLSLSVVFLIVNAHISSVFYSKFTEQVPVKYKAKIITEGNNLVFSPGQRAVIKFKLINEGSEVWDSSKPDPVKLSYVILNREMKKVDRTENEIVIPGKISYYFFVELDLPLVIPSKRGVYYVEFSLKRENNAVYRLPEKVRIKVE